MKNAYELGLIYIYICIFIYIHSCIIYTICILNCVKRQTTSETSPVSMCVLQCFVPCIFFYSWWDGIPKDQRSRGMLRVGDESNISKIPKTLGHILAEGGYSFYCRIGIFSIMPLPPNIFLI